MTLIKCFDCSENISDQAFVCPKCGRPLRAITIERTNKIWKLITLVGAAIGLIGLWGVVQLFSNNNLFDTTFTNVAKSTPMLVLFTGVLVIIIGRFGAWWNNG